MKNCEAILKFAVVTYNHGGPEMSMVIKNMDKPTVKVPEFTEYTSGRVDIFVC